MTEQNNTEAINKRRKKWRNSWQIPVFVLGLIVLGISFAYKSISDEKLGGTNSVIFEKVNSLVKASDYDSAQIACGEIIEKYTADVFLQSKAKIYYAEISLLKFEKSYQPRDSEEAFKTLKNIKQETLKTEDSDKLNFLLAKACILIRTNMKPALLALEKIALESKDDSESLALICLGYMTLPEPDYIKALKANEEFRNLPLLSDDKRIPAQIIGGELLMKLHRPDDARKVLQNITSKSNPALEIKARQLLAHSYMEESLWLESVNILKQVLESPKEILEDMGKPLYFMGYCLKKIELPREAEKSWIECEQKSKGDERYAASFQLAQIYLESKSFSQLANSLAILVRNCKSEKEWSNSYFTIVQIQNFFEKAQAESSQAREFELALKINDSLQKIFPKNKALGLRADVLNTWADAKLKESDDSLDSNLTKTLKRAGLELLVEAGTLNLKSASLFDNPIKSLDELCKATARFRKGGDLQKAKQSLLLFIPSAGNDKRLGDALYQLGEVQKELGQTEEAKSSYLTSLKYQGPHTYKARYQIAIILMERNELDQAADTLEQNLQLLRFDPDTEVQEKSLFALGSIFFQRKNYRMVVRRYEEALERFGKNNQAVRARLQLAESYRQLANQEQQNFILGEKTTSETKNHYQAEHQKWLQKSADTYQDLEQLADSPLGITQLSEDERLLIPLLAAECKFNMGQYEAAMLVYAKFSVKTKGKKEMLHALGGLVRCHSALGQFELVQQRLNELKAQLNDMDETVRKEWEPWLAIASKPIQK